MTTTKTKTIRYNQANSEVALNFGYHEEGCYTVMTLDERYHQNHLKSFNTEKEAVTHANTLDLPWHWMDIKFNREYLLN